MIAAVAKNRAIGYKNKLLYWLPEDMKRFRQLTTGHTIVMGRLTFESLPKGALPNRRNCVLTRSAKVLSGSASGPLEANAGESPTHPGCECFKNWDEFIATCQPDEDIYIIGGASLYRSLLDKADRLCLTEVDDTPEEADAFFPDYSSWQEETREHHSADERHSHAYDFVEYVKG